MTTAQIESVFEKKDDALLEGVFSNCCGARIYDPNVCSKCYERCSFDKLDKDEYDERLDNINPFLQ